MSSDGKEADPARAERARRRRSRMRTNRARSFEEAERWDLEFWQSVSPQERLSALVAIRRDIEKIRGRRLED